ncbi:MAG: hypothetical protein DWQ36_17490 [Acidobacteria bacterium]|nr:MAG: hypothetical protein DWQ30_16060 [Acidobacteriota bacterium]REK04237.1 MAG: hypothetical protein DWQ36_17490 [Acidobacteriota bacterium]
MTRIGPLPGLLLLTSCLLVGCGGAASDPPEESPKPSLEEQQPISTEDFEEGDLGSLDPADNNEPDGDEDEAAEGDESLPETTPPE